MSSLTSASRQICILSPSRLCLVSLPPTSVAAATHDFVCAADTTATFYENNLEDNSLSSADESYQTARGTTPEVEHKERPPSYAEPLLPSPEWSRRSSLGMSDTDDSHSESGIMLDPPGYHSPPPMDERLAEFRNERRYRMLLQHEFHPSCTCTPLAVSLQVLTCAFFSVAALVDTEPDPPGVRGVPLEAGRAVRHAVQCLQAPRIVRRPDGQHGIH